MEEKNKNFSTYEKGIADEVADEILTVYEEDDDRSFFFLLLFFFICLIFLISTVSFAIFDTYRNGSSNNAVDVGVNTDVDNKCTKNCDTDGDGICDKYCDKESTPDDKGNVSKMNDVNKDKVKDKDKDKDKDDKEHPIDPGTILFSYNEGSNYIDMVDVFPTADEIGMALAGNREYFDFNVSVSYIKKKKKAPITYEIVAVPNKSNTLSTSDVRTYLTAGGSGVSILSNDVNNFSALPDSAITRNGKILYKKTVNANNNTSYVFRMWMSSKAKLPSDARVFGCKIVVNGYYAS